MLAASEEPDFLLFVLGHVHDPILGWHCPPRMALDGVSTATHKIPNCMDTFSMVPHRMSCS
jgi:hypothetical protein